MCSSDLCSSIQRSGSLVWLLKGVLWKFLEVPGSSWKFLEVPVLTTPFMTRVFFSHAGSLWISVPLPFQTTVTSTHRDAGAEAHGKKVRGGEGMFVLFPVRSRGSQPPTSLKRHVIGLFKSDPSKLIKK